MQILKATALNLSIMYERDTPSLNFFFFMMGSFLLFNIKDDNKRKALHRQTVGREANSAQSYDEGIIAITEAALPH